MLSDHLTVSNADPTITLWPNKVEIFWFEIGNFGGFDVISIKLCIYVATKNLRHSLKNEFLSAI